MSFLLWIQAGITILAALAAYFTMGENAGFSLGLGGLTILLNFSLLIFAWPRILAKKQVALAIIAIVFKFAILIWILYAVANSQRVSLPWFAVGLGLTVPSVIFAALRNSKISDQPHGEIES